MPGGRPPAPGPGCWWRPAAAPDAAPTRQPPLVALPLPGAGEPKQSARSATLRERTTPELSYLQTRFAALVSNGLSADMLNKILPLGRVLHTTTVRRQVQATAQRL